MQDRQEWIFRRLGNCTKYWCLCKCNPHILFALGSGANAPFRSMPRRLRRTSRTAAARHPDLGSTKGAFAPRCGSTLRKTMVGPPRRRGPKIQARMRCFVRCQGGCAAQVGRRRRAIPTLGSRKALSRQPCARSPGRDILRHVPFLSIGVATSPMTIHTSSLPKRDSRALSFPVPQSGLAT